MSLTVTILRTKWEHRAVCANQQSEALDRRIQSLRETLAFGKNDGLLYALRSAQEQHRKTEQWRRFCRAMVSALDALATGAALCGQLRARL
jgi:hypothetical protein